MNCEHPNTELKGKSRAEWCLDCGAIREMRLVGWKSTPAGDWILPLGNGGEKAGKARRVNQGKAAVKGEGG